MEKIKKVSNYFLLQFSSLHQINVKLILQSQKSHPIKHLNLYRFYKLYVSIYSLWKLCLLSIFPVCPWMWQVALPRMSQSYGTAIELSYVCSYQCFQCRKLPCFRWTLNLCNPFDLLNGKQSFCQKKKSWGRRSKIYQGRGLDGERAVCDLMHEFCIRCWWCHYILRQRWVSIQSVDGYENSDADGRILWRSGFWRENSEILVFWLPKY